MHVISKLAAAALGAGAAVGVFVYPTSAATVGEKALALFSAEPANPALERLRQFYDDEHAANLDKIAQISNFMRWKKADTACLERSPEVEQAAAALKITLPATAYCNHHHNE